MLEPFGAHPDDRVALLDHTGRELAYASYERQAAGAWRVNEDGSLSNEERVAFPTCAGDGRQHWTGGLALYRGNARQRTLMFGDRCGIFDGITIWFGPGQIRVPSPAEIAA